MPHNRIFLSHKSTDRATVNAYREILDAMGLSPFMYEEENTASDSLLRRISEWMEQSTAIVFFISPEFEDADYLRIEVDLALQHRLVRKNGFKIIVLLLPDKNGKYGQIPSPLLGRVYKQCNTDIDGLSFVLNSLPNHLKKTPQYVSLSEVVPLNANQVALIGQNLCTRMWLDDNRYNKALDEIRTLLKLRPSLRNLLLVMMTPTALAGIHPEAAEHLRVHSLPGLRKLAADLPEEKRIEVVFHPSATLSAICVDWATPRDSFAVVTPKFQRTSGIDNRLSVLLDEDEFDASSLTRMLDDAFTKGDSACRCSLGEAYSVLEQLLNEAGL